MASRLDPADRRQLVRLMLEEGLSPQAAAARLGVSESTARRWRARAHEVLAAPAPSPDEHDRALELAERSIRDAEALMGSLLAPVARRPAHRRTARPVTVPLAPRLVQRIPAHVRALSWSRRQAGGVALTVAFVPVGWFLSAVVFAGSEAARPPAAGAGASSSVERFVPELAAARGRGKGTTLAAHVRPESVYLHRRPGGKRIGRLHTRRIEGQRVPLVLLVERRRRGWLRVHLPVRPNGSKAWISARHVRLRVNPYRIRISLRRHRLTLWRHGRLTMVRKVGVGQSLAPTPTGRYFVTDLIKARDARDVYGPYSFGLSAHSPVYTSFRGGNGQIGLHGTNEPQALGSDVSHGCIRVSNRTIRALAGQLPLGTPVDIRR